MAWGFELQTSHLRARNSDLATFLTLLFCVVVYLKNRCEAMRCDTEKCQQMLAARAEVDVRSKKWTPLMGAAELGHAGVVSLLLENKANVNAANKKGCSALSFAASPSDDGATRRESQIPVVDYLLSHGADVHMRDITGRTALQRALMNREKWSF